MGGLPASKRPPKSPCRREIWGFELFFSGCPIQGKKTRDEFLYLASNRFNGKEALGLYRRRWGIEQVFSHFKKRGFDPETTHMSDPRKIEKRFGVLTVTFMFSYGWGCEMKSKTKLTARQKRKRIFRLGLDRIAQIFGHKEDFAAETRAFLHWIDEPK